MIPIPPALLRSLQGLDPELLERIKTAYQQEKDQYLTAVAAELDTLRDKPGRIAKLQEQISRLTGDLEDEREAHRRDEEAHAEDILALRLEWRDARDESIWRATHPFRNLWGWLLRRKP